jgi:hypothetical protein
MRSSSSFGSDFLLGLLIGLVMLIAVGLVVVYLGHEGLRGHPGEGEITSVTNAPSR